MPHDRSASIKPVNLAESLAELHRALADYSGPRAEHSRLSALLPLGGQALHGDAHPGNVLATPSGLVWNDFEDTWRGLCLWHRLRRRGSAPG